MQEEHHESMTRLHESSIKIWWCISVQFQDRNQSYCEDIIRNFCQFCLVQFLSCYFCFLHGLLHLPCHATFGGLQPVMWGSKYSRLFLSFYFCQWRNRNIFQRGQIPETKSLFPIFSRRIRLFPVEIFHIGTRTPNKFMPDLNLVAYHISCMAVI